MRRRLFILLLLPGACLAGVVSAFLICGSIAGRDAIGILLGRGHLLALACGTGIYEVDLERALSESRYANGANENFALMPAGWAGGAKRPFDRELLDCVAAHFTAG